MKKKLLLKNSYLSKLAVVFVCALFFSGCSENKPQTPEPVVAPVHSPNITAMPPKPVQSQTSSVLRPSPPLANQFDFSDKKDPFKPFVTVNTVTKGSPGASRTGLRSSLPIHSFDVNQFKLIGIITGDHGNRAMVTDPSGKGYVLKTGMLIGKNDGKIIAITPGGVDVLEQFKDDNGRVRKEKIILTLPRKQ